MNRFRHYVRGVEVIVALHRPIHETIYRDSTLSNELIDAMPVSADRQDGSERLGVSAAR